MVTNLKIDGGDSAAQAQAFTYSMSVQGDNRKALLNDCIFFRAHDLRPTVTRPTIRVRSEAPGRHERWLRVMRRVSAAIPGDCDQLLAREGREIPSRQSAMGGFASAVQVIDTW